MEQVLLSQRTAIVLALMSLFKVIFGTRPVLLPSIELNVIWVFQGLFLF